MSFGIRLKRSAVSEKNAALVQEAVGPAYRFAQQAAGPSMSMAAFRLCVVPQLLSTSAVRRSKRNPAGRIGHARQMSPASTRCAHDRSERTPLAPYARLTRPVRRLLQLTSLAGYAQAARAHPRSHAPSIFGGIVAGKAYLSRPRRNQTGSPATSGRKSCHVGTRGEPPCKSPSPAVRGILRQNRRDFTRKSQLTAGVRSVRRIPRDCAGH